MQDKISGAKLLASQQTHNSDLEETDLSTVPPELAFILKAFQKPHNFQLVLELALPEELYANLSDGFLDLLESLFTQSSDDSFPQLKNLILELVAIEEKEQALQAIALLELTSNKMALFQSKQRKTDFDQALGFLQAQTAEEREKEKLNSLEFRNSPAHQYRKYAH